MNIPLNYPSIILPLDGSDNGTVFTNHGTAPVSFSGSGTAKTVTSEFNFYDSSAYFDGSGSYIVSTYNSDIYLSGDFTLAIWFKLASDPASSTYPRLFTKRSDTSGEMIVFMTTGGNTHFKINGNNQTHIHYGSTFGEWHHLAITRESGLIRVFADGIQTGSLSTTEVIGGSREFWLGRDYNTSTSYRYNGYLQDFLCINGHALWTADFELPGRLMGEVTGSVRDESGNPVSRNVILMPKTLPTQLYRTLSDEVTGDFTIRLPASECDRIILHEGSPEKADSFGGILPV